MNGISHQQAIKLIHQRLDGILDGNQKSLLDEHLRDCNPCRTYSNEMEQLPARLQYEFQARWDQIEGPSKNMVAQIEKQNRRVIMSNRISFGFKAAASVIAVMLVGLLINTVVSQMRDQAVTLTETSNSSVLVSSLPDVRLLAFTSTQDGNHEIYTIHADGSGITNLTNNPAADTSPYWSPDGKSIAFASNRTGFWQIYIMEADGSNVIQLTKNNADHLLPLTMDFKADPWSPDGNTLLFLQQDPGEDTWALKSITLNGLKETQLVTGRISHSGISWSPDGNYVGLIQNDAKSDNANDFVAKLYVVSSDGTNSQDITDVFQPNERLFASLYSWSADGQSISLVSYWRQQHIDETKVYEVRLDDHSVTEKYSTNSLLNNWQDAMTIAVMPDSTWLSNWVRPDGTSRAFNPTENCQPVDNSHSEAHISRSSLGSWVMLGYCSNGDHWLYWANTDGTTIKQLMNSSLPQIGTSFISFAWSPDDRYIAFNFASPNKTVMYILDVDSALTDPSVQPEQVILADGEFYTAPTWQPLSNRELVEEKPAPEPTPGIESKILPPIGTTISNGEWIAFIAGIDALEGGASDPSSIPLHQNVFLIHPDGSSLTNVTNFYAHYFDLQWSPNGQHLLFLRENSALNKIDVLRHSAGSSDSSTITLPISDPDHYGYSWSPMSDKIVFADSSSGNYDIYTVYADGRNDPKLTQLTNDPGQDVGFVWSPDGSQIAFQRLNGDELSIYVMNEDGTDPREVAHGMGKVRLRWSMDGQSLFANSIYRWENTKYSHLECEGCIVKPAVYEIDLNGPSVHQIYYEENSNSFFYLYDTPQNKLYFLSVEERDASIGLWGTWRSWDGNSIHEIGEMDPHQTCLTTTGSILNEHISPNNRYSVISNYCAGGFDLYLADREALDPEKKLIHLLRLPLNTWGQGGDGATIPIVWSPDGRWLIYSDDGRNMYLVLLDLEKATHDPDQAITPLLQEQYITDASEQEFQLPMPTVFDLVWQPNP